MNLETQWLGLDLKNPFVPSASPLSRSLDTARELEDAGASAIVMYSLFEEAVSAEEEGLVHFLHHQDHGHAEANDFLPDHLDFPGELDRYLEQIQALKTSLDIPIVASLNGVTDSGWLDHASEIQAAGADALELNVYYVANGYQEDSLSVEQRYVDLLQSLKTEVDLPINMKLSPFFSSVGHMAKRLHDEGVDGVTLFNRFYQPDIQIDSIRLQHSLHPSTDADTLLAMRWMAMLHGCLDLSLAASGGVRNHEDAIKLLLAGADVVHLCTGLLQKGPGLIEAILSELEVWMEDHGFETVDEFRGLLSRNCAVDPGSFERVNYLRVLDGYSRDTGVWK